MPQSIAHQLSFLSTPASPDKKMKGELRRRFNAYYLEIRFKDKESNYFPFETILINNYCFDLCPLQENNTNIILYVPSEKGSKPPKGWDGHIFCIRGLSNNKSILEEFVPHEISVNGKWFIRRFDSLFAPQHPTVADITHFFDLIASDYGNLIDTDLNYQLTDRMLRYFRVHNSSSRDNLSILDYGTGTGIPYQILKKKKSAFWKRVILSGCDLSNNMLQFCRRTGFHQVKSCGYADLRYPDCNFDMVFAAFVVHYFIDKKPFHEMRRVLKPKGLFMFNLLRTPHSMVKYYIDVLWDAEFTDVKGTNWTITTSEKERCMPIITARRP